MHKLHQIQKDCLKRDSPRFDSTLNRTLAVKTDGLLMIRCPCWSVIN
jgi:hypothetical protein